MHLVIVIKGFPHICDRIAVLGDNESIDGAIFVLEFLQHRLLSLLVLDVSFVIFHPLFLCGAMVRILSSFLLVKADDRRLQCGGSMG